MTTENALVFFAKFIENEVGIVYAEHNYFQLQNRLEEISKTLGYPSVLALFEQGQKEISGQFKQLLLDISTNNETSFFRDPKVFSAIETKLLPQLAARPAGSPPVQIWSAASSSGQEALSMAMLIKEWSLKTGKPIDFRITATDICERILTKARKGHYTQFEVQRGLPENLQTKYFKKTPSDTWSVNADLLANIEYRKVNLADKFTFAQPFDMILCRNVLIYQRIQGKASILRKIHESLARTGVLILGSGESLIGLSDDFTSASVENAVFFSKRETAARAA